MLIFPHIIVIGEHLDIHEFRILVILSTNTSVSDSFAEAGISNRRFSISTFLFPMGNCPFYIHSWTFPHLRGFYRPKNKIVEQFPHGRCSSHHLSYKCKCFSALEGSTPNPSNNVLCFLKSQWNFYNCMKLSLFVVFIVCIVLQLSIASVAILFLLLWHLWTYTNTLLWKI